MKHYRHLLTPRELRTRPGLLAELRSGGTPEGMAELRFSPGGAEVRAADDGSWKGGGLAIVYNSRSENLGGFVEVIKPGAVRDVLAREPDTRALFNHEPNLVLGRTRSGTLRLDDQAEGLDYEFDAPDTSYARDLRVLLDRGDVSQSSFAFRVAPDGAEWDEDPDTGLLLRIVHRLSALYDVSPVTYPAYQAASSGLRSDSLANEAESDDPSAPERREDDDDAAEAQKAEARAAYEARQRRARLRGKRL